jgi:mRNA interferase HigB
MESQNSGDVGFPQLMDRMKATFDKADFVKGYAVFNVGGKDYRIVARVICPAQAVLISEVLTHAQYGRWKP